MRAYQVVVLLGLAFSFAYAALGAQDAAGSGFFVELVSSALLLLLPAGCLARAALRTAERGAWLFFGLALTAWITGAVYFKIHLVDLRPIPFPSFADACWLAFYPLSYVALVLLVRARLRPFYGSLWLDGLIGGLAVGALGAAVVFDPVLETTKGDVATVATNLAYPLGDMLLLALVVGVFGLTGWRPGRSWALLGAGLLLMAVADSVFLYLTATGSYVDGSIPEPLWPTGMALMVFAAWQPPAEWRPIRMEGWRILALPSLFTLGSLLLLVFDHFERTSTAAVMLATATIAAAVVRTGLTFREMRLLSDSRRLARTDELTGLGNRRKLIEDLEQAAVAADATPRLLVMLDLDGFKHYNDCYGHPAGDALLQRFGSRLAGAVGSRGEAFRLGGDEFCVLVTPGPGEREERVQSARAALSEGGRGFAIGASYGSVLLPQEAGDAQTALRTADRRLYAQKERRPVSVKAQTRGLLLTLLQEQQPTLREHVRDVAEWAVFVGRRLGMQNEELDVVGRAAELHDIGKVAVPESILEKPGPLTLEEWAFIRQHTLMGERILAAAPALRPVALLVRSSHERYDGGGYPDGLTGDQIPLGARIVGVCDAFDAMVSDRSYRKGMSYPDALEELRRSAGTQFDPRVVEVFCELMEGDEDARSQPPGSAVEEPDPDGRSRMRGDDRS